MGFFDTYVSYFTKCYDDSDYLTRKRAKAYCYFVAGLEIILAVLFILALAVGIRGTTDWYWYLGAILLAIFLYLSLFILKKGKYNLAINITLFFSGFIVMLLGIDKAINEPELVFLSSSFFWICFIVGSMMFATKRHVIWVWLTIILFMVLLRIFLITPDTVPPESWEFTQIGFIYSGIAILVSGLLGILTVKMFEDSIEHSKKEKKKLNEKEKFNEELLNKIKKTMSSLYEASNEMKSTVDNFGELSQNQKALMESLSGTSHDLTKSSADINNATDDQNKDITSLKEKLMELIGIIDKVNEYSKEFSTHFNVLDDNIDSTKKALKSMDSEISQLTQGQDQMKEIIQMIQELFDQINLLALNASIEAARAGEAGKGFEVVAMEIRKIADNSSGKLTEISNVINTNLERMKESANEADKTQSTVEGMINEVFEIKKVSQEIFENLEAQKTVKDDINEKTTNVKSQADSISEISSKQKASMEETDELIKKNTEATKVIEDKTTTLDKYSKELSDLSNDLKGLLDKKS